MTDPFVEALRTEVQRLFHIELPISGGRGLSQDDALVLEIDDMSLAPALEYAYLDFVEYFSDRSWDLVRQEFVERGGTPYDLMHIKLSGNSDIDRTFYFDLTRPHQCTKEYELRIGQPNPYLPPRDEVEG